MKLSQTPQPNMSKYLSNSVVNTYVRVGTADVHQMCYSRVSLLTEEIERLSDVLTSKGQQADLQQMMLDQMESQSNQYRVELRTLGFEHERTLDQVRVKTIELEDYKSQYHRITEIVLKEKDQKLNELVEEIGKLGEVIDEKDNELISAKDQFVRKAQELSEANQQMFHLENAVKVVKDEKLQYVHEYQLKEQQLREAHQTIEELAIIKQNYESLKLDIELIRKNYSDLFEQNQQEKRKLQEQLEVHRTMAQFSVEDVENKYINLIKEQQAQLTAEYEQKLRFITVQAEGNLDSYKNILHAKQSELEQLYLNQQNNSIAQQVAIQQDMYARDDYIIELRGQNVGLQDIFESTNNELKRYEKDVREGKLIKADQMLIYQERIDELEFQLRNLRDQNINIEEENLILKQKLKQIKDEYIGMYATNQKLEDQLKEHNQLRDRVVTLENQNQQYKKYIQEVKKDQSNQKLLFEGLRRETEYKNNLEKQQSQSASKAALNDQDKIAFLIHQIDKKDLKLKENSELIQQLGRKINELTNEEYYKLQDPKGPTQSISYYHVNDEDLNNFISNRDSKKE